MTAFTDLRHKPWLLPFAVALVLGGCGGCSSRSERCVDDSMEPGISVTVVDSATGVSVTADASLLAVDGRYRDSVSGSAGAVRLVAAYERAGTYALTVRRAGYRDWTRSGVTVPRDGCHVVTQAFTARLQR